MIENTLISTDSAICKRVNQQRNLTIISGVAGGTWFIPTKTMYRKREIFTTFDQKQEEKFYNSVKIAAFSIKFTDFSQGFSSLTWMDSLETKVSKRYGMRPE